MGILRNYINNGVPVANRIKFESDNKPLVVKNVPLVADAKVPTYTTEASRRLTDLERVAKLMIKPEGLMDYEQYAGWLSKQEEDPEASFDDFYVSDYTPTETTDEEGGDNETESKDKTYFDLRGEGAFEESFLDKMGGLSSLIGLATG